MIIKKHQLITDESHTCSPTNFYTSMYLYQQPQNWIHAHRRRRRSYYLQLFSFSTSFSLFPLYNNSTSIQWMKKISFGLYMRLCVFNIIFLFYISWALFCFLLTSQFSSALRFVQTRGEISRLLRNLFKTFCFAFCYFTILFFLLKVSERQQFHRNFWFVFFAFFL